MIDHKKNLKFTITSSFGTGGRFYGPYTDRETPIWVIRKILINKGLSLGQADAEIKRLADEQKVNISKKVEEIPSPNAPKGVNLEEPLIIGDADAEEPETITVAELLAKAFESSKLDTDSWNGLPDEKKIEIIKNEFDSLSKDPEKEDEDPEEKNGDEDTRKEQPLPDDFPGRKELLDIGYDTVGKVRAVAKSKAALVDLPGIGDKRADQILEWFNLTKS